MPNLGFGRDLMSISVIFLASRLLRKVKFLGRITAFLFIKVVEFGQLIETTYSKLKFYILPHLLFTTIIRGRW